MPATRISGPGLSKGGPEGRRGLKGDKPAYELDGLRIRWERPDGSPGEWIDLNDVVGLRFQGDWDAATAYENNDLVRYGNATYVARRDSLGAEPGTSDLDWRLFVPGGTVGDGAITNATVATPPTPDQGINAAKIASFLSAPNLVRAADWKFSRILDFSDHRDVVADGVKSIIPGETPTNNTPFFQEMIDYAQARDREIGVSSGWYALGKAEAGNYCLLLNGRSRVRGMGMGSQLDPRFSLGVDSSVDTFRLKPDVGGVGADWSFKGLFLGSIADGRRRGRAGLWIDTSVAGSNLPTPIITENFICQSWFEELGGWGSGAAIHHQNDESQNVNGGLFGALIFGNRALAGGVRLRETGDSNNVFFNVIYGENNVEQLTYRCIGLDIECCQSDGGGGSFTGHANNITTKGGAARVGPCNVLYLTDNFGEIKDADAGIPYQMVSGETGRAIYVIGNPVSASLVGGRVAGNRCGMTGGVGTLITAGIYVRNTRGLEIGWNQHSNSGAAGGMYGVVLDSDCGDNIVHPQQFQTGWTPGRYVRDLGSRNLVDESVTLTPQNGFSNFGSGFAPLSASQTSQGIVALDGYLNAPASPNATVICTLPARLRSESTIDIPVQADNAGVPVAAYVLINHNGEVTFFCGSATVTRVSLGGVTYRKTPMAHRSV